MNKHERRFETKGSCCTVERHRCKVGQRFSHWGSSDRVSILTVFPQTKKLGKKKKKSQKSAVVSEAAGSIFGSPEAYGVLQTPRVAAEWLLYGRFSVPPPFLRRVSAWANRRPERSAEAEVAQRRGGVGVDDASEWSV